MNHTENLIRSLKVEIRNKSWKMQRLRSSVQGKRWLHRAMDCLHTRTRTCHLFLQFFMLEQAKPDLVHNLPCDRNILNMQQSSCQLNKQAQSKSWELFFYLAGIFRTSNGWDSISSNPEITSPRRQEKPGYTDLLQQRAGSLNFKRLLLIRGNQISQVKKCSAFLWMGRCKSLDSLKSFLSYASPLSGASLSELELRWGSPAGVGSDCSP